MTLLELFKQICNEIGLPEPVTVIGSTDLQTKQLLAIALRVGNDFRDKEWPSLQREQSITLVASQDSYAFPADFDRQVFDTAWNQSSHWPLTGPLTPDEWQAYKNGFVAPGIAPRYRIKGYKQKTFFVDPTPSSSEAGQILVQEYQTVNWIKPRTWENSAVYTAGSYTFYDGVYYSTVAGGTTSGTSPADDVGVTWVVSTAAYDKFLADTDELNVDDFLFMLGVQWNYLAAKGLPYQHLKDKYNGDMMAQLARARGARTLSICPGPRYRAPFFNIPQVIPT